MLLENVTILSLPVEEENVEDSVSVKRNAMIFVVLVRLKYLGQAIASPILMSSMHFAGSYMYPYIHSWHKCTTVITGVFIECDETWWELKPDKA